MLRQFIILIALKKKSSMLMSNTYYMIHLYWSEKVPDNNDTAQSDHLGNQQNQLFKFLDVSSITYSMPFDDDF